MQQLIYIADDEINIRELIAAFLTQEGFNVRTFTDGDSLFAECKIHLPDLIILDIMMPGTDGLSICSMLRNISKLIPIIIVSAKDSPFDRVTGLNLGSDDYLVKPFLPLELVARVRSLLRRSNLATDDQKNFKELSFGELQLFPQKRYAILNDKPFSLTPTEFDFLSYLIEHKDRAVNREELLQNLWQMDWQADTRATDDLVKRLRRKLRNSNCSIRIETVWGYGFRISSSGEADENA